jgi:hypothetical protein
MKIFWSWQSDTLGKIGRFFVRDALGDAIDQLREELDIEDRESIHLDQDRQGVPGSPDLVATIFDKIDKAEVFVADITLVGQTPESVGNSGEPIPGKKLINSNVAIELGYALRALTDRKVLLVFNSNYGAHEELPFDLRHKGGSITFSLPPSATKETIALERKRLTGTLKVALTPYLKAAAVPKFNEISSTFSPAAYFDKREILAQIGDPDSDEISYSYSTDSLCYVRVIPMRPLPRPLPLAALTTLAQRAPLLTNQRLGVSSTHNSHGAIIYESGSNPSVRDGRLNASTQLFENGEVWSINTSLIVKERGGRPPGIKLPFIAMQPFERTCQAHLATLLAFVKEQLGIDSPWQVEIGLVGIKGLNLIVPPGEFWGPIRKTDIIHRAICNSADLNVVGELAGEFFNKIFDATGYARPANLQETGGTAR